MINRLALLNGVDQTIINPIVNKVTCDINNKLILDSDVFKYYETFYSKENVDLKDNIFNKSLGKDTLYVDYEVIVNDSPYNRANAFKPISKMLVLDKDNGFNIRPVYINTDINFKFRYSNKSKTSVQRVLDRLRLYNRSGGYNIIHNLEYSYLLPTPVIDLIKNIATLKNIPNYLDYLDNIAIYKFDLAIKKGSDYKVPVLRRKQSNVIGRILTEPKDIKIDKKDTQQYYIEFDYRISFEYAMALYIQYPIIVNNNKIDDKWIPANTNVKKIDNSSGSLNIVSIIEENFLNRDNQVLFHVPTYDDFYPYDYDIHNDKIRLVSILLTVDPNDTNFIFNIDDLKYIGLQDYILNYFKENKGTDLFNIGHSLFLIELYEYNKIIDKKMYIDDENNVKTEDELDIDSTYHIVINLITDLTIIYYYQKENLDNDKIEKDLIMLKTLGLSYDFKNRVLGLIKY